MSIKILNVDNITQNIHYFIKHLYLMDAIRYLNLLLRKNMWI